MAIPRILWTSWINHDPASMPELIKHCIETQKKCADKFGYEHKTIGISDCFKFIEDYGSRYLKECLSRKDVKGYVKCSDWIRVYKIWEEGGIYLDADMEVLEGKNFDHLLDCKMFVPKDPHEHFGNAGFGAEAGDPILEYYLKRIEDNFRGEGDMIYEAGVRGFSDHFYMKDHSYVRILTPDYFFPMNRHSRETDNLTENTLVKHWYANSWIDQR